MPTDPDVPRPLEAATPEELERRRRRRDLALVLVSFAALAGVIAVEQRIASLPDSVPFADSLPFVALNAVSVVLIVLLLYLSGRQLVKLWFERRAGIFGAHLNAKFVLALFLVATVPMGIQVAISSSLITASINAWFGMQMDRAIDDSGEVASAYYDAWRNISLHYARQVSGEVTERGLLRSGGSAELERFVAAKQREYGLGVVQIFQFDAPPPLATPADPARTDEARVARESSLVAAALEGEEGTRVDEASAGGDVIRAAVPIRAIDPAHAGEVVGVVVVNHVVPQALAYKVDAIRAAVAEYRNVQPLAERIGSVFTLVLMIFSLVIVLVRDLVGPAHGQGRDRADPRAGRGHRRRSRAATSTSWSSRRRTTRSASSCARSTA